MATFLDQQKELLDKRKKTALGAIDAQEGTTKRNVLMNAQRAGAIAGTTGGGAQQKLENKALTNVGKEFGSLKSGVESDFAQQEQAAALQDRQMTTQEDQFKQTLDFQKNSFADQMKYQWSEFDENKKTNFLNAAVAMKDAGLNNPNQWVSLYSSLTGIYGQDRTQPFTPMLGKPHVPGKSYVS